jgi:glycosyltransferase involved in cell wall biosynthesis
VPSESFVRYIPKQFSFKNILVLPPGCDNYEPGNTKPISDTLNILYVGNIAPPEHDVTLIFDVARAIRGTINEIKFIISCPADVWKTYQNYYLGSNSAPSNIEIVHKKPNDISDLFIKCDLFILPINDEYSAMASPNRFYTALGFEVPFIIASNYDTEVGKIVKRDNIGWVVNHSVYSIISLLKAIKDNITMLELAKDNLKRIKSDHTWNKRAIFVADTLENIGLYK